MPIMHELIDNIALQVSNNESSKMCFSRFDLKNVYSQPKLCDDSDKM